MNPTAPIQSEETIYMPATQVAGPMLMVHVWFQPSWVVRTAGPVEGLTGQMQKALAAVDPALPFSGFYRMSDLQATALSEQRVEVALLGTMAGLALLLSAVGIFALVASLVTQRTRDIGIRIALGSTIRKAMANTAASGLAASFAGLALGLVLCFVALRAMSSLLYGVGVYDLPSLSVVIATLATVSLLAAVMPALRIASIDPARTLREE
jgi:ABC-type antimicrobial peptide transport system permease subunit